MEVPPFPLSAVLACVDATGESSHSGCEHDLDGFNITFERWEY